MEHFNGILFHKSGPASKQHSYHSSRITGPLRSETFQLAASLTCSCPQTEVDCHPAWSGQPLLLAKFLTMLAWHRSHTLVKFKDLIEIFYIVAYLSNMTFITQLAKFLTMLAWHRSHTLVQFKDLTEIFYIVAYLNNITFLLMMECRKTSHKVTRSIPSTGTWVSCLHTLGLVHSGLFSSCLMEKQRSSLIHFTERNVAFCQTVAEVQLTGLVPLEAVSHIFSC